MVYIPNTDSQRKEMLRAAGVDSFDQLFAEAVPRKLWEKVLFEFPPPLTEPELELFLRKLSSKNLSSSEAISFMGAGCYNHYIPSAVPALIFRSEFYTAYTPYQAEVSQGTLQAIFEYQTMVSEIMGMEVSNASLYDGASACAEAAILALSHTGRKKIIMPGSMHPDYIRVVETYLSGQQVELVKFSSDNGVFGGDDSLSSIDDKTAAVFIQQPNFFGVLEDADKIIETAKNKGALSIMVADPVSLGVLKSPGEYGADIAVAEGQPFGVPQSLGGPYLGMITVNKELIRRLPGRLVSRTVDGRGNTGYCLTLQTREQHIRREKATSNICTNQALCALAATVYLSLLGPTGLKRLGELATENAHYAYERITKLKGFSPRFDGPFFREFVVRTAMKPSELIEQCAKRKILPGVEFSRFGIGLDDCLMMAFTELTGPSQIEELVDTLKETTSIGD